MCNEMITKVNVKFKSIEEKIYKYVCQIGLEMIKTLLEELDNKILQDVKKMKTRDLICHDIVETSIKTRLGVCTFKRRKYYEYTTEKGKRKYKCTRYLLDEILETRFEGMYSEAFIECILKSFENAESYRMASEICSELTNESISHERVRQIIIKVSETEIENEKELEKACEKGILVPNEQKEIEMLFGEVDGLFVRLQGKDKEKIIEKAKENIEKKYTGEELESQKEKLENTKVKKELKLGMTHEGWRKIGKDRYELEGKEYVIGFDTPKELSKKMNAKIENKYDVEKIKHIVINGDGAGWISKICPSSLKTKKIYQRDSYHICEELRKKLDIEHAEMLEKLFKLKEYKCMRDTLESLEEYYSEDEKRYKEYKETSKYISKGLERYQDVIKELPKAPEGLEYRNMGNAESNIYQVLSSKLSSKRKSFSLKGALAVAYVMKERILKRNILEKVREEVKIDNSDEEWTKELEKKARKNKVPKYEGQIEKYEYPIQSSIQEALPYLANVIGDENIGSYCFN